MRRLALLASVVLAVAAPARTPAQPAPAATGPESCVAVDDFSKSRPGAFPLDWQPRKDAGRQVYTVLEEPGLRYLRAVSRGLGIQAARQVDGWDLVTHPILAWAWRPREFPRGADEREAASNDSALAVYMLVPYSRIVGPKAVKYVWSERVPVGTRLQSNSGLTQALVLRSGSAAREAWTEERVNVLEHYRQFFGEAGAVKPAGIAVLTDSDDTRSSAAGDYARFRVCRAP
jgi:hypothetical protein